jgi:hypothetical protein
VEYPRLAAERHPGAMSTSAKSTVELVQRIPVTDEQNQFRAAVRRFLNDKLRAGSNAHR